ncbi:MAG TPA: hypothetical protein VNI84_21100 [Pyrinomonadaceae bacterium]|nr:hypothetical protein [Pyrinomonadaceae bacterium]
MPNATRDEMIDGAIEAFDGGREAIVDDLATVKLLVKNEFQSKSYRVLKTLTGGWFLYFSKYYSSFVLQVATRDPIFRKISSQVTHIALLDNGVSGTVYEIPPDRRQVVAPNGDIPYYEIFCQQTEPLETYGL